MRVGAAVGRAAALRRGPAHLLCGRETEIDERPQERGADPPLSRELSYVARQLYRAPRLRQKEQRTELLSAQDCSCRAAVPLADRVCAGTSETRDKRLRGDNVRLKLRFPLGY